MIPRPFLFFMIAVALFGGIGGTAAIILQRAQPWPTTRVGGPFEVRDTTGLTVTQADFLGKPSVIYFGFTHCPDACPTALFSLSESLRALGTAGDKLNVAFATVDPERDTAEQLKLYLGSFDPRIRGLTGTMEQMSDMARRYHIVARRVPTNDGDYVVDHSTAVLLLDRQGRQVGAIDHDEDVASFTGKLKRLVNPNTCVPGAPGSMWEASVVKGSASQSCI